MLELGWLRREPPLAVAGVLAQGGVASEFASRLADTLGPASDVRVLVGDDCLVALGESGDLPWVDGAVWLGLDGPLFCPTTLQPNVPPDVAARAVTKHAGSGGVVVLTPTIAFSAPAPIGPPPAEKLRAMAADLSRPSR
ncbi:MAG: hypothetical protein GY701_10020 [Sulfitobacter sp.]|nr:hypothetical protein [Sulfitobacter sp.]